MNHHNSIADVLIWGWHGINVALFGLTISPALENMEAYVRIGSGMIVGLSAGVALCFTIIKNLPKKKRKFNKKTRK